MNNPKYLTHPNIPKPLHGINPRTIKGQKWWDIQRQKAYATNAYHCWACGIHKSQAKYHKWLEAHESYDINYKTGRVQLVEIIALCHSCHNFIHSGRLYMLWKKKEISTGKAIYILNRGFNILEDAGLSPFEGTKHVAFLITGTNNLGYEYVEANQSIEMAPWEDWHLVIDNEKYYSKFKNMQEWQEYYKRV